MKEPLKPRDKIVQKMTREGVIEINETKSEAKRISNRIRDADFQTAPEQPPQEAEPSSAASVSSTPTALIQHPQSRIPGQPSAFLNGLTRDIPAAPAKRQCKERSGKQRQKQNPPACSLPRKNAASQS